MSLQSLVDQLKDLGIAEKTARFALQKNNNNVNLAADYVFSGNAGKDEVSENEVQPGATGSAVRSTTSPSTTLETLIEGKPLHVVPPSNATGLLVTSGFVDSPVDVSSPLAASRSWSIGRLASLPTRLRRLSTDKTGRGDPVVDDAGDEPVRNAHKLTQIFNDTLPSDTAPATTNDHSVSPSCTILGSLDDQASSLILNAMSRSGTGQSGGIGGAFAAMGLKNAGLGLSGTTAKVGSPPAADESKPVVRQPSRPVGASSGHSSHSGRAPSPFFRARSSRENARGRDKSPEVGALKKDSYESDGESVGGSKHYLPQTSAYEDDESEFEVDTDEEDELNDDELELLADDGGVKFDAETTHNTEANAVFFDGDAGHLGGKADDVASDGRFDTFGEDVEQDILGEGPNVVVPPEPLFPTSLMNPPVRRKTLQSGLELATSRPSYARDRCTITLTQGDPDAALEQNGKRLRRYVVLSDLSEESKYAVEWAVGTVARDGDEVFLISVKEDENRVDPKTWSDSDKANKLRNQRERQQMALLLTKQVTSLLQRTKLHITVTCQFLHAKNARHMLLDLIDFLEPSMAIVGSRGLGKLKGILLGSTSHYLVQKSSVPVMVARRRLQRPLRKTDPKDLRHSPRVNLASASIEKAASSKQEDEELDVAKDEELAASATE